MVYPVPSRLWFLGLIPIALVIGFGVYSCASQRSIKADVTQADRAHAVVVAEVAKAEVLDQVAAKRTPVLQSGAREIARLQAEVTRLRAISQQVPTVLDTAKDDLLDAQATRIPILEAQVETLTESRDAWRTAAGASQQEAGHLRTALGRQPAYRPMAINLIYGTDKTLGLGFEYDAGPLRLGVDVVRHPAGTTGRTTLEAVGRVGWRF